MYCDETIIAGNNMEIFLTIFAGVSIVVIVQIIIRFYLEPLQEMKKTISEISLSLINYANIYCNPNISDTEKNMGAYQDLRMLASKLNSHLYLIPFYEKTGKILRLPSKEDINDASSGLIFISNSIHQGVENMDFGEKCNERSKQICKLLKIYIPE